MHPSYIPLYDTHTGRWVSPSMTKHGLNSDYLAILNETPVAVFESGPCPDCGAKMHLKVGRYGRYYRCSRYKRHACGGACSAQLNGQYTGKPVPSSLRKLRRQIVLLKELRTEEGIPVKTLLMERYPGIDLRESDEKLCQETIAFLASLVPPNALDHILGDTYDDLDRPMKDKYVVYEALGREHQAGPYEASQVQSHVDDISGYEGISNVRIVDAKDLNTKRSNHTGRRPKTPAKTALDYVLDDET
jgi:hypothetical protein